MFGNSSTFFYPVMMGTEGSLEFITTGEYIQWSLLGTTITAFLVISVCLFISLLMRHSMATLLTTVTLLIVGYFVMQAFPLEGKSWYDPFQFVFAGLSVQKVGALWYQSVPIVLLLAIIIYMFSLFKINKTGLNS